MQWIFLDARRRLRNGWWMLIFIALIAAERLYLKVDEQSLSNFTITPEKIN